MNSVRSLLPLIGVLLYSQALMAEEVEDRSTEFAGATAGDGRTRLQLSLEHYQSRSLYTERNALGAITFQERTEYRESGIRARISHGFTDEWELGLIVPVNQIRIKSTETIGGNAVTRQEKNGIGNLQVTSAYSGDIGQDTYLYVETIFGFPSDTRSHLIVGGANASAELSLTHYFGKWGVQGSTSRYFSAEKKYQDWSHSDTHKVGISTELIRNLHGSAFLGNSDGYRFAELVFEKHLPGNRTLEFSITSDTEGPRDSYFASIGLIVSLP